MNDKISSLVDRELKSSERERIYDLLTEDAAARKAWERYHTIGALLRREMEWTLSPDFADRVAAEVALEDRPTRAVTWTKGRRGLVSRLAIAASVAVIALFGLHVTDRPTEGPASPGGAPSLASALLPSGVPVQDASFRGAERWNQLSPRAQRRLNGLLLEHSQFSPEAGADSFIGYVRIVGFDRTTHTTAKATK